MDTKTQREKILELLDDRHDTEVPLYEILALGIAQYNARIFELRRTGYEIVNRTEEIDGTRHSWYTLVRPKPKPKPKPEPVQSVDAPNKAQGALF